MTLTLPTQRDPIARAALILLACGAMYLAMIMPSAPAQAEQASQAPIIIIATPTLGVPLDPTAPPAMVPGLAQAQPTQPPAVAEVAPTPEPQVEHAAPAEYLANVGDQAPHSPRGSDRQEVQILPTASPEPSTVDPNAAAVALPTIAPEQAAVIASRQSNGCAPGQVFVPRSGCHTPGSGGAMPGAVRP